MDELLKRLTNPVQTATDYVRGASSKIIPTIRQFNGDWSLWLPMYEPQKFKFDTNECSQLSGINNVELQCNFLKGKGLFSQEALNWFQNNGYFDESGSFAFSERFTAILSGTSILGGSQWTFWQTISKNGLLPRKDLNYSIQQSNQFTIQADMCADYYNPSVITFEMRQKALQSLQWLQIQYEWIGNVPNATTPVADVVEALNQAPLHVGVPICSVATWNSGVVTFCGLNDPMHAITLYGRNADGTWNIRDHYHPENKILSANYNMPLITLGYVTAVPLTGTGYKHRFDTDIQYGSQGDEVKALQTALSQLGYLDARYITGNYFDFTAKAVYNFQMDYKVANWFVIFFNRGRYCYLSTRTALNKIFNT